MSALFSRVIQTQPSFTRKMHTLVCELPHAAWESASGSEISNTLGLSTWTLPVKTVTNTRYKLYRCGVVGRALDSRLRNRGFKSCAAVSNLRQVVFTRHNFSSLSYTTEYLAVYSGGYLCTNNLRTLIALWLKSFQRNGDGVRLNRSVREKSVPL